MCFFPHLNCITGSISVHYLSLTQPVAISHCTAKAVQLEHEAIVSRQRLLPSTERQYRILFVLLRPLQISNKLPRKSYVSEYRLTLLDVMA